jgi:hypothetical protein
MSRFKESYEYAPKNFEQTDFGFALVQDGMPHRHDVFWLKTPERHLYSFDGDAWFRLHPPEPKLYPPTHLNHG